MSQKKGSKKDDGTKRVAKKELNPSKPQMGDIVVGRSFKQTREQAVKKMVNKLADARKGDEKKR